MPTKIIDPYVIMKHAIIIPKLKGIEFVITKIHRNSVKPATQNCTNLSFFQNHGIGIKIKIAHVIVNRKRFHRSMYMPIKGERVIAYDIANTKNERTAPDASSSCESILLLLLFFDKCLFIYFNVS